VLLCDWKGLRETGDPVHNPVRSLERRTARRAAHRDAADLRAYHQDVLANDTSTTLKRSIAPTTQSKRRALLMTNQPYTGLGKGCREDPARLALLGEDRAGRPQGDVAAPRLRIRAADDALPRHRPPQ
jgi:hypothetical protein